MKTPIKHERMKARLSLTSKVFGRSQK